jgi:hypothetical protein
MRSVLFAGTAIYPVKLSCRAAVKKSRGRLTVAMFELPAQNSVFAGFHQKQN